MGLPAPYPAVGARRGRLSKRKVIAAIVVCVLLALFGSIRLGGGRIEFSAHVGSIQPSQRVSQWVYGVTPAVPAVRTAFGDVGLRLTATHRRQCELRSGCRGVLEHLDPAGAGKITVFVFKSAAAAKRAGLDMRQHATVIALNDASTWRGNDGLRVQKALLSLVPTH